jgi:Cu/Ag efflux pump CusA
VRAQIAVKIFGDDTDTLRGLAEQHARPVGHRAGAGRPDRREAGADPADHRAAGPRKAAQMGLSPGEAIRVLQALTDGAHGAEIVDGRAATNWCCACPTSAQPAGPGAHADRHAGRAPAGVGIATVEETDGPNQIGRENGRRRIIVYANTDGGDMGG